MKTRSGRALIGSRFKESDRACTAVSFGSRSRRGRPLRYLGQSLRPRRLSSAIANRYKESPAKSTLIVNTGTIKSIAFRPDGAMLFSVGFDGSLAMLDLTTRLEIPDPPQGLGPVRCAAFSPDNRVLATANATATVSLHDLVDHRSRTLYDISASTTDAACLAFSPDGATLAVGQQDGKITLWDAATGRKRSTLLGHTEFVASLAFAPDGTTLASSGGERMTRIWDLPTSRERFAIASPTSTFDVLAFSPDGRLLCGADPTTPIVRLWDVATGIERARCAVLRVRSSHWQSAPTAPRWPPPAIKE